MDCNTLFFLKKTLLANSLKLYYYGMKACTFLFIFFISTFSNAQEYKLIHSTKSLIGEHKIYHSIHKGLPVFNQYLKQNIFNREIESFYTSSKLLPLNRKLLSSDRILKSEYGYLKDNENIFFVIASTVMSEKGKSYTLYIDNNQETIHHLIHSCSLKDTTISGNVFYPDPLSSSSKFYGGYFVDNNDETNSYLNNELAEIKLTASFKEGKFFLENKHLKIVNHSAPDIDPRVKTDSIFRFNRSETGFEEVNAMYHISRFADYIKDSIGFDNIMNYQIAVDVYALNGNDNSEFISSTEPPRLNFGQGGIDDAEDADILIHEYAHAVSHSAAPGSLIGYERLAMDEGFGDYWASVYSKMLNDYNYKELFNWDGHNEFWEGRSIDHQRKYNEGLNGDKYIDGELFAAMLMDIRNNIEDSAADKIILQSTYSWYPNMTFSNAIKQILKADTLLNNAKNIGLIEWLACKRGFLTGNCETNVQKPENSIALDYKVNQNRLLAFNQEIALSKVQLFNLEGKMIFYDFVSGKQIQLPALHRGVYILRINELSEKIILE